MIKKAGGKSTGGVANLTILRSWHVGAYFVSLTGNIRVAAIMTEFAGNWISYCACDRFGRVINKRRFEGRSDMAITAIGSGIKMALYFNYRYGVGTIMAGLAG